VPGDHEPLTPSPVVELRRYRLRPGQRDTLIDLFDHELVEPQEEFGMLVLGQFRDTDDPDSFVWLRGFPGMTSRRRSLAAFYGGPTWRAHAKAANDTMLDSDNVLLARAGWPVIATYQTEHSPNTFPALPVRADEEVFVSMTIQADLAAYVQQAERLESSPAWRDAREELCVDWLSGQPETLRLIPTARSWLHA
jgi:NIPSNAP protein